MTTAQDDPGAVVQMTPVTVSTATRTPHLLTEVPVRTEVVLREDIELRAALNLSQAIALLNGVRVESNCQNCNTSEVQLLGLGGAYNQILFDGTPLLSALGGVYGLEQVPAAFVDRLEVVKGGGSALYGAGAVGGVVNLMPVAPVESGGFVNAGVEMQKGVPLYQADVRVDRVRADGKAGFSAVAQSLRNDGIDFDGDGFTEITEKDLLFAGFHFRYAPASGTKLGAHYHYTWEERRGGGDLDRPEHLARIAESLHTRFHRGGLTWDQVVSPDFGFRAAYAFAHIERDSYYGGLGDPSAPDYDPEAAAAVAFDQYGWTRNPLHYLDAQFNRRHGDHAFVFGVQHKHESILDENRNADGVTLAAVADASYTNTGICLQDEWTVSRRLDLVLGARVDWNSELDDPVLSPRLAAAFAVTPTLKLRAGLSTGFRAPEIFSEDLHVNTLGGAPIPVRNAPGLDKESAVTGMLALDWRSDPVSPRWSWDATLSGTTIRDTFLLTRLPDGAGGEFEERSNASGSRVAGFEANLAFQPGRSFRLTAGLAYYQSRYRNAEVVFDDTADGGATVIAVRDRLKTPEWSGVAQAVWTPAEGWSTYAGLNYTGRMTVLNNNRRTLNRTSEFWVLDLGVTRHIELGGGRHCDVSIGVKNLLDERQKDLESGASRDSDYVYGPRFARSFQASVRYEF